MTFDDLSPLQQAIIRSTGHDPEDIEEITFVNEMDGSSYIQVRLRPRVTDVEISVTVDGVEVGR